MTQTQTGQKAFARRLLGGFLIGVAFLMPGISGGALAATLGYFEPAVEALSTIRQDTRGKIRYLLPLGIGGVVGAFLVAVALVQVLEAAETQAICFFMGMLAGTIPKLWRDAYRRDKPGRREGLFILAGLAVTAVLFVLQSTMRGAADRAITMPIALASGGIFGAGAVVPGISGSFFLIYLGWYKGLMEAIVTLNIPLILMMGLGFVLAILVLVKVAHWLFRNRRRPTMSVIIGFVAGSLALVWPADFFGPLWWANILLLLAGIGTGLALGRLEAVE